MVADAIFGNQCVLILWRLLLFWISAYPELNAITQRVKILYVHCWLVDRYSTFTPYLVLYFLAEVCLRMKGLSPLLLFCIALGCASALCLPLSLSCHSISNNYNKINLDACKTICMESFFLFFLFCISIIII